MSSLTRRLIAAGLSAGGFAGAALAVDVSFSGLVGQRFEAVSRTGDDEGSGLRSITDIGVAALLNTPTTSWRLAPGLRGVLSSLDGDSGSDMSFRFNGSVVHREPRNQYTGTLSIIPDFADESRLEDGGRTRTDALQLTAVARVGLDHQVNSRNSISTGAFFQTRTYIDGGDSLGDTRSYGFDSTWQHNLQADTVATLRGAVRRFESDTATGTDGITFSLTPGFQYQVSPDFSLVAALGPAVTWSEANPRRGTGESIDFGGVGSLTGNLTGDDYRLSLGISQDVDQNNDGELRTSSVLRGSGSYRINAVSQLALGFSLGFQSFLDGEQDDRTFFSLTPSYSYEITRDWSVGVGYRLRVTSDDDFGTNNTVFVRFTRGLDFLP